MGTWIEGIFHFGDLQYCEHGGNCGAIRWMRRIWWCRVRERSIWPLFASWGHWYDKHRSTLIFECCTTARRVDWSLHCPWVEGASSLSWCEDWIRPLSPPTRADTLCSETICWGFASCRIRIGRLIGASICLSSEQRSPRYARQNSTLGACNYAALLTQTTTTMWMLMVTMRRSLALLPYLNELNINKCINSDNMHKWMSTKDDWRIFFFKWESTSAIDGQVEVGMAAVDAGRGSQSIAIYSIVVQVIFRNEYMQLYFKLQQSNILGKRFLNIVSKKRDLRIFSVAVKDCFCDSSAVSDIRRLFLE